MPGHFLTPEHRGKFIAGGIRARHRRKLRAAEVSSGRNLGGGLNEDNRPQRAHLETSPAVWYPATEYIGDCEYVDDGVDEYLMRAVQTRIVYAGSACCLHQVPFCDVTVTMLVAIDKEFQKSGKRASRGLLKKVEPKKQVKRSGKPLPEVVASMFPERKGKSLIEVVSEMFPEGS